MKVVHIDWSDGWLHRPDLWINHGRSVLEQHCSHKNKEQTDTNMRYSGYCEECDACEDSAAPMMNYGYPLEFEPSDEKILRVVQETCCTVMENTNTGQFFLVLCGGGMNLSQDIAYAYMICDGCIDWDLLLDVSWSGEISVNKEQYMELLVELHRQSSIMLDKYQELHKGVAAKLSTLAVQG